jgi:hypothetical protein
MFSLQLHYVRETQIATCTERKFAESMKIVADRDLEQQIYENKTNKGESSWKFRIILICSTNVQLHF